jgi:hypothetical protein
VAREDLYDVLVAVKILSRIPVSYKNTPTATKMTTANVGKHTHVKKYEKKKKQIYVFLIFF